MTELLGQHDLVAGGRLSHFDAATIMPTDDSYASGSVVGFDCAGLLFSPPRIQNAERRSANV